MWDVKVLVPRKGKHPDCPFYLNYVGCKAKISNIELSSHTSFTLTMWDVKQKQSPCLLDLSTVLP